MKRIFAIIMALAVSLSCIPSMAYAETESAATSATKGNCHCFQMQKNKLKILM